MLKEYLENSDTTMKLEWQEIMSGANLCLVEMDHSQGNYPLLLDPVLGKDRLEIFLCFHGSLMVERKVGAPINVASNEIFLLSNIDRVHTARITSPLSGILIVVDRTKIEDSLNQLNQLFYNHKSITNENRARLEKHHECCVLENTQWSQTFFSALRNYSLHPSSQKNYSVFKMIELFFLIHTDNAILQNKTSEQDSDSYLFQTITKVKDYMEAHLDEHLTIDYLSNMFHISATTLKANFREIYGQPIHQWLQTKRMKKSADLLYNSNMTVLQIAQLVGYEGVSQFNVIFKRYYGVTPGQYRKMSNTVKSRL